MSAPTRIRWTVTPDGGYTGRAGAVPADLFRIWPPCDRDPEWIVTSALPHLAGSARYRDDPAEAKGDAEEWLAEFLAMLAAPHPPVAADDSNHEGEQR